MPPASGVWMSGQEGVVAVTCLALEAGIARGPGVSVICNQSSGLRAALGAAIARGASGIISFGIAGGLAPDLVAGDWVVASGVRSGKNVIATDRAWAQTTPRDTSKRRSRTRRRRGCRDRRAPQKSFSFTMRRGRLPSIWSRTLRPRLPPSIAFRSLLAVSSSMQPTERFHPPRPWGCASTARRMFPRYSARSGKTHTSFPISSA